MAFTEYVEMVHPEGGTVRIGVGPTQGEKDKTIAYYRRKGFKLPEEAAKDAELEALRKAVASKKGA